jgi:hypothetical protein
MEDKTGENPREQACMIVDDRGNVVEVGHPSCVMKRRDYWEEKGYRLEIADKEEALEKYREYVKSLDDRDFT